MFCYRSIGLCAVLLLILVGCAPASTPALDPCTAPPPAADAPKVLLIVRENPRNMELSLEREVGVMVCMLKTAGLKVEVASASGSPIASGGATIKPDLKLADVKVEDYAGFILPCMAVGLDVDSESIPPEAVEIVKQAVTQGKPVAAQDSAVLILAIADVLEGKQFAIGADKQKSVLKGTFAGYGVVQDGNIITSGSCPSRARITGTQDTTAELTQKLIDAVAAAK